MKLTSIDSLIMLPYFVFVLGFEFALKRYMKMIEDFSRRGALCPHGFAALAFISAKLGA